jgi:para-nitrobenzyl esterase
MVGATSHEWRFFLVPSGVIPHISAEALAGVVAAYGLPVERALEAYRAADPAAGAGDLLAEIQGDWYVRIPVMRLALSSTPWGAEQSPSLEPTRRNFLPM